MQPGGWQAAAQGPGRPRRPAAEALEAGPSAPSPLRGAPSPWCLGWGLR